MSSTGADEEDSDLTLYQQLFDIACSLCKAFPSLTPFALRRTEAREVFLLIKRINTQPKTRSGRKVDSNGVERRPAGDKWF